MRRRTKCIQGERCLIVFEIQEPSQFYGLPLQYFQASVAQATALKCKTRLARIWPGLFSS